MIDSSNNQVIEPGMVFHVRITLDCKMAKEKKNLVVAMGDTVLIDKDGEPEILTKGIPKKFSQLSYTFDDEEEEKEEEVTEKGKVKKNAVYHLGGPGGQKDGV